MITVGNVIRRKNVNKVIRIEFGSETGGFQRMKKRVGSGREHMLIQTNGNTGQMCSKMTEMR